MSSSNSESNPDSPTLVESSQSKRRQPQRGTTSRAPRARKSTAASSQRGTRTTRHLVSNFRSQDCRTRYLNYRNQSKPIAYGEIVDWSFVSANRDLLIQWWIDEQGWEKFLKINAKAFTDLVYVFYANLVKHENDDDGSV